MSMASCPARRRLPHAALCGLTVIVLALMPVIPGVNASDAPAGANDGLPEPQTIVTDMTGMNDHPLKGAPKGPQWATGPGTVIMGNEPRGSNTPDYWNPSNQKYKSPEYWRALIPWLVVYAGQGNAATDTRVELRDLTVFLQSRKTGQWRRLGHSRGVVGENYPVTIRGADTTPADLAITDGGWTSLLPEENRVFHGWWKYGKLRIDAADIANVYVRLQARLVPDDGWFSSDDTNKAQYLVQVGADYWPDTNTPLSALAPTGYIPGVGGSRFKSLTRQWQWINFTTVAPDKVATLLPPERHRDKSP